MDTAKVAVAMVCAVCLVLSCGQVLAAENTLYADKFDNLDNWDLEGAKSQVAKENELASSWGAWGAVLKRDLGPDAIVQCQMKVDKQPKGACAGVIHLRYTRKDTDQFAYRVEFRPKSVDGGSGHILIMYYGTTPKGYEKPKMLLQTRWDGEFDTWYDVRISIKGNAITAFVDGEEKCTTTDKSNHAPQGRFGLASQHTIVHFKELKIMSVAGN